MLKTLQQNYLKLSKPNISLKYSRLYIRNETSRLSSVVREALSLHDNFSQGKNNIRTFIRDDTIDKKHASRDKHQQ